MPHAAFDRERILALDQAHVIQSMNEFVKDERRG